MGALCAHFACAPVHSRGAPGQCPVPADPGRKPQAIFGLGMCDPRGWDATQSAIAVTGAQAAIGEWKHFAHSFSTLSDAPGADILFRFENAAAPVSGTVEFKNLKVEIKSGATYPAYPALSSFASRSADGKTLYLIVFNRAPEKAEPSLRAAWKVKVLPSTVMFRASRPSIFDS